MTGIMIMVASVTRSRVIWMNSLIVIAQKRPKDMPPLLFLVSCEGTVI